MAKSAKQNVNQPTGDFRRLASIQNLTLAWDRLERAREPAYKWYWRPALSVGFKAKKIIIARISRQLLNDGFKPDDVCLYSEPKASTLLRHRSILALGDHLVFQAIGNIVADKLHAKIKRRYLVNIFSHLHGGSTSKFFYKKWEYGYKAFNIENRRTFNSGSHWLVQFDFASFYDSIGHGVVERLLLELGVGDDVARLLCKKLLPTWSCAGDDFTKLHRIVLDTGIPQGPLPSPVLAELVLSYIDEHMSKLQNITYLRYADDIKIWGTTQGQVRMAAAILDRLARNIGIFPQSKKFTIEKVADIGEVLKEISHADTPLRSLSKSLQFTEAEYNQGGFIPRLHELVSRLSEPSESKPQLITEFKFFLARAVADDALAIRLSQLMKEMPHLTESCCHYMEQLQAPSKLLINELILLVNHYPGYPWLSGRLLRVLWHLRKKMSSEHKAMLRPRVALLLKQTGIRTDCQLQGVAMLMLSELNKVRMERLQDWLWDPKTSTWAITHVVLNIGEDRVRGTFLRAILTDLLKHHHQEVARAAAHRLCSLGERIPNLPMDEHGECKAVFDSFDLGSKEPRKASRINHLYSVILSHYGVSGHANPKIDWHKILGNKYDIFDSYATQLLGETRASGDLFANLLFAAWEGVLTNVWDQLGCSDMDHDTGLKLGKDRNKKVRRAEKFRKNSDLRLRMPAFCNFVLALDDLRHHGHASHSENDHTHTRNKPILFRHLRRVLLLLPNAWVELAREFPET